MAEPRGELGLSHREDDCYFIEYSQDTQEVCTLLHFLWPEKDLVDKKEPSIIYLELKSVQNFYSSLKVFFVLHLSIVYNG